jgi:hypothetical protein
MPGKLSQLRHGLRGLLAWSAAPIMVLAACVDNEPTAPTLNQSKAGAARTFGAAIAAKAKQLEPIKERLSGSAYRLFFGQRERAARSGFRLGLGQGRSASPRDFADVLVNDPSGPGLVQSEETIADHGGTIVAGFNDATGFYPDHFDEGVTGWAVSPDRGRTFLDGGGLPRIPTPGFFHAGDPGLAVGNNGTFFFADLCFDFSTAPALSGVCVTAGRRQGRTIDWRTPVYAASSLPDFLDKSFIATDRQGQDVYVSYTRFQFVDTTFVGQPIEVVASHDAGRSFGPPVVVGPFIGLGQQWSEPAVGPNGEVYVTWIRETSLGSATVQIVISKSTDGGRTFTPPLVVQTIDPGFAAPSGYNREDMIDPPRIDVARTGRYRGEVYVVYHAAGADGPEVFLTRSPDGFSWSATVLVNDDVTDFQFWPVVAVEPGGNVDVMWYDRRLNPGTAITNTFWSQSTDNGRTFRPNVRLSDVGSDWAAAAWDAIPNFGDYNDISAGGNRTYAAWGDGRLGDPDVFFSELKGTGKTHPPLLAVLGPRTGLSQGAP